MFNSFSGQQSRADHDGRIGGVGTRGDSCDDHAAVFQFKGFPFSCHGGCCWCSFPDHGAALFERCRHFRNLDPVLWTGRTRQRRHDVIQPDVNHLAVLRFFIATEEHALLFHVCFHPVRICCPVGQSEIMGDLFVHRHKSACGTVFWRHVGQGGPVRQGQVLDAGSEEFNEFFHYFLCPEPLGYRQHQVGCGNAFRHFAGQPNTHHLWNGHEIGLSHHDGLCFNAAHTPSQHTDSIDHGGVRIGTDQGVGECQTFAINSPVSDHLCNVFQVDLVDNAGPRRENPNIVKGLLGPLQQLIPFPVPLIFHFQVFLVGIGAAEKIHLYRVVDDQINGHHRVDGSGVAPPFRHGIPHGRQIHNTGDAGKILHDHPGGIPGDFLLVGIAGLPVCQFPDVVVRDVLAVLVSQEVFQQGTDGKGEPVHLAQAGPFRRGQAVVLVINAVYRKRLLWIHDCSFAGSYSGSSFITLACPCRLSSIT